MKFLYFIFIGILFLSCEKSTIPLGEIEHSINFADTSSLLFLDYNKDTGEPELSIRAEIEIETYPDSFFIDEIELKLFDVSGSESLLNKNYTLEDSEFTLEGNRLKFYLDKYPIKRFKDDPKLLIKPNINTVYRNEIVSTQPPVLIYTDIEYRSQDPRLSLLEVSVPHLNPVDLMWGKDSNTFYFVSPAYRTDPELYYLYKYDIKNKELDELYSSEKHLNILACAPNNDDLILCKINNYSDSLYFDLVLYNENTKNEQHIQTFQDSVYLDSWMKVSKVFFNNSGTKFLFHFNTTNFHTDRYIVYNYPDLTIEQTYLNYDTYLLQGWSENEQYIYISDYGDVIKVNISDIYEFNTIEVDNSLAKFFDLENIFHYTTYPTCYFYLHNYLENTTTQLSYTPIDLDYNDLFDISNDKSKIIFYGSIHYNNTNSNKNAFYLLDLNK